MEKKKNEGFKVKELINQLENFNPEKETNINHISFIEVDDPFKYKQSISEISKPNIINKQSDEICTKYMNNNLVYLHKIKIIRAKYLECGETIYLDNDQNNNKIKKIIDLDFFQDIIDDIKTIRNSIIPERTCYNLEMKWKELQKKYKKK